MRFSTELAAKLTTDVGNISILLERIWHRYHPLSIWLFGSRAKGSHRPDSDWDLLVVIDDEAPEKDLDLFETFEVRNGTGIAADIIPIRHREFVEDSTVPGALPYEVMQHGALLDERR